MALISSTWLEGGLYSVQMFVSFLCDDALHKLGNIMLLSVLGALCLFLTVSSVGLQCVIVAFLNHTSLLFEVHYT